jgi:hypothetical protein
LSLRLILEAPARVPIGEPVPLVLTVRNAGRSALTLHLMGREPSADFRVEEAGGRRIWSFLHGKSTMAPLRLLPLEPGAALTIRGAWSQRTDDGIPVPPGDYRIRAVLLTDHPDGMASSPVRLRVGQ